MQHGSAGLHAAAFESSGNLSSIGQLQSHALSHNEQAKKRRFKRLFWLIPVHRHLESN
jgi:hypothetical protein